MHLESRQDQFYFYDLYGFIELQSDKALQTTNLTNYIHIGNLFIANYACNA